MEEYIPKKYPGKIILFGAKTLPAGFKDHFSCGFNEIAEEGVALNKIPAYPRGTLVEPFVKVLAEKLERCIEEAEADYQNRQASA